MKTTWNEHNKDKSYPKLSQNLQADVTIIGGGITGVMAAYFLSNAGKKVVLLETKSIGSGATEYTTAFMSQTLDTDLTSLIKMFGDRKAKLAWDSGAKAIDVIEEIINKEQIDCDFMRCVAYVYASDENQLESIKQDYASAGKLKFKTFLNTSNTLGFNNYGHWEVPNQAKFHPLKFLYALAEKTEQKGALIFENTKALSISSEGGITVMTENARINTKDVMIATYNPFNNPKGVFAKKGMYKSYVLELELPKNLLAEGIYWDESNPYYYFRIDRQDKFDRMILGGADHRNELPVNSDKSYQALLNHLHEILGGVEYKIVKKWAGPILEPSDGLPLIGEYKPHHFLASAFSGNGMTYSAVSAMMFKDYVLGIKNIWAEVYDPLRKLKPYRILKKGKDYIEEFFGGAVRNTFKFRGTTKS